MPSHQRLRGLLRRASLLTLPFAFALLGQDAAIGQTPSSAPVATAASPKSPALDVNSDPALKEVVVRVGSTSVTRGEIEKRLREAPQAALALLGSTPEEVRKNFVERFIVRELLLAEEAKARGLEQNPGVREHTLGILRLALVNEVRRETKSDSITNEDVQTFYAANPDKFVLPKRLALHQIVVESEAEARELIAELGEEPDPKVWAELAREKSIDKDTNLRAGTLGLVTEEGKTQDEERKVDPALFKAADKLKDGQLLQEPVKVGRNFVLVWKRQTLPPTSRSMAAETPAIRAAIADQRVREGMTTLLEGLRSAHVSEKYPELCGLIGIAQDGEVEPTKRPGTFPRAKRTADVRVQEGPAGLR